MHSELIIIKEYCLNSNIEPEFISQLNDEGLIEIVIVDNVPHLQASQLKSIEQYACWHYDLEINVAGIDMIRNLLDKMDEMREEIASLKKKLQLID